MIPYTMDLAVNTDGVALDPVSETGPLGAPGWRALRRSLTVLVYALLPAALALAILSASFARGPFLYDFDGGLYKAGTAIVNGQSPYRADYVEHRAALNRSARPGAAVLSVPVYPPPVLLATMPLSLLPYPVAGMLFTLLSIAALIVGLRLLGVRDWRCFGVAFASWPVLHGLMLGGLTPLLVLGIGLAWRWRTAIAVPALSIAAVVGAKLFPWPLGVWLLVTGRLRAAALAAALAVAGVVGAWALIGFAGMSSYPHMLASLDSLSASAGVSLVAAMLALGVGATFAQFSALAVAVALLCVAWLLGRSGHGDRRAMGLAVVAALLASPIVWPHYFAMAFVPIALLSPRLSPLWFTPLLTWFAPVAQSSGHPWAIVPYLAVAAALTARLCAVRRPTPRSAFPSPRLTPPKHFFA
jgi:Glycosyltransferase family 87